MTWKHLLALLVLSACGPSGAGSGSDTTATRPLKVLYVGPRFLGSDTELFATLEALSRKAGAPVEVVRGQRLGVGVDSSADQIDAALETCKAGVVLMHMYPEGADFSPSSFGAMLHAGWIDKLRAIRTRAEAREARVVLIQVWPRPTVNAYGADAAAWHARNAPATDALAAATGVELCPAGDGFARLSFGADGLELYGRREQNRLDPTPAASYLVACLLLQTLCDVAPSAGHRPDEVDEATAARLRRLAAELRGRPAPAPASIPSVPPALRGEWVLQVADVVLHLDLAEHRVRLRDSSGAAIEGALGGVAAEGDRLALMIGRRQRDGVVWLLFFGQRLDEDRLRVQLRARMKDALPPLGADLFTTGFVFRRRAAHDRLGARPAFVDPGRDKTRAIHADATERLEARKIAIEGKPPGRLPQAPSWDAAVAMQEALIAAGFNPFAGRKALSAALAKHIQPQTSTIDPADRGWHWKALRAAVGSWTRAIARRDSAALEPRRVGREQLRDLAGRVHPDLGKMMATSAPRQAQLAAAFGRQWKEMAALEGPIVFVRLHVEHLVQRLGTALVGVEVHFDIGEQRFVLKPWRTFYCAGQWRCLGYSLYPSRWAKTKGGSRDPAKLLALWPVEEPPLLGLFERALTTGTWETLRARQADRAQVTAWLGASASDEERGRRASLLEQAMKHLRPGEVAAWIEGRPTPRPAQMALIQFGVDQTAGGHLEFRIGGLTASCATKGGVIDVELAPLLRHEGRWRFVVPSLRRR